jgi:hypothetical protein
LQGFSSEVLSNYRHRRSLTSGSRG